MTDPKEQVVSEALCRNHISGFGEVCAGVCGDSTVPGQPHPCEHALTVWRSDAQEILRALLARVDPKALEELDLASRAIERAHALLAGEGNSVAAGAAPIDPWQPISTGPKRGEYVLLFEPTSTLIVGYYDDCDHAWLNGYGEYDGPLSPTHWMPLPDPPGADANHQNKTGVTQASDSLARPSLEETVSRYRYAIDWVASDSWDYCSECRDRIAWARQQDPAHRLSGDEMSALAKKYFTETGRPSSSPSPAVRDALDHLHAMAPGIRDLDALDAVEKDDESMRSAVRDGLPTGRRHVLKTWPMYFQPLLDGKKTFELRKNDRDFRVGDILELREYDLKNDHYSGRITEVAVTYVLERGELGLAVGFCVLGIAAFSSPLREALERENEDLKAFIRGIGINCQRAAETLSQVAASAALPPTPKDESAGK